MRREMEESISCQTLKFLLFLHAFLISSCHMMALWIMDAEEKEESFSSKEFECQIYWTPFHICIEFMEES